MAEILALIARIILIIAKGLGATEATMRVSKEMGIDFKKLWCFLPNK